MTYIPTEWACGDTITAEKLNKLENGLADCCGGGSEPLILSYTTEEIPCPSDPSKTTQKKTYNYSWQEIHDALLSGKQIFYINHGYGIPTTVEQYQIDLAVGARAPSMWTRPGMEIEHSPLPLLTLQVRNTQKIVPATQNKRLTI